MDRCSSGLFSITVMDLVKALLGNDSVNTFQHTSVFYVVRATQQ
jgi:hypothetical protein